MNKHFSKEDIKNDQQEQEKMPSIFFVLGKYKAKPYWYATSHSLV